MSREKNCSMIAYKKYCVDILLHFQKKIITIHIYNHASVCYKQKNTLTLIHIQVKYVNGARLCGSIFFFFLEKKFLCDDRNKNEI